MNAFSLARAAGRRAWLAALLLLSISAAPAVANERLDRTLIAALQNRDLDAARRALDAGANPNAVLGTSLKDHALCSAIDVGGTEALQLLIDAGGRVDLVADTQPALQTSITCAIYTYNPEAFERVLELGADPNVDLCPECPPRLRRTAFTEALAFSRWPMALRLTEVADIAPGEIEFLVQTLEESPFDATHPWLVVREKLIDWVREQGISVDPRPASPNPDGGGPRCVFSPRDLMEGRAEPSICPDDYTRED